MTMRRLAAFTILLILLIGNDGYAQESIRYVFVDAKCAAGFEALPDADQKHILTSIREMTFDDPAKVMFAENDVKGLFKAAIKDKYPDSLNQLEGVYVYILNSAEEARVSKDQLADKYRSRGIALIEMDL